MAQSIAVRFSELNSFCSSMRRNPLSSFWECCSHRWRKAYIPPRYLLPLLTPSARPPQASLASYPITLRTHFSIRRCQFYTTLAGICKVCHRQPQISACRSNNQDPVLQAHRVHPLWPGISLEASCYLHYCVIRDVHQYELRWLVWIFFQTGRVQGACFQIFGAEPLHHPLLGFVTNILRL